MKMTIHSLRGNGRSLIVVVVSMLVFVSCACAPAPRPGSGNFTARVITSDGAYSVAVSGGNLNVRNGGSQRGADTRIVVTEAGSPANSVCATIKPVRGGLTAFSQPGVALHVRSSGGRTTVTGAPASSARAATRRNKGWPETNSSNLSRPPIRLDAPAARIMISGSAAQVTG